MGGRKKKKKKSNTSLQANSIAGSTKKKSIYNLRTFIYFITIFGFILALWLWYNGYKKQQKIDIQLTQSYQTEIVNFFTQFKICLHWTLPLGENADLLIDSVFFYNSNLLRAIKVDKINHKLVKDIFVRHDFTKQMKNYNDIQNLNPTGLNHILGNLARFNHQVNEHLKKYGSTSSSHITERIEYVNHIAKAVSEKIKLDMGVKDELYESTMDMISEFVCYLQEDLYWIQEEYGSDVNPILIGEVTKSDSVNGEIAVRWEYGKY